MIILKIYKKKFKSYSWVWKFWGALIRLVVSVPIEIWYREWNKLLNAAGRQDASNLRILLEKSKFRKDSKASAS